MLRLGYLIASPRDCKPPRLFPIIRERTDSSSGVNAGNCGCRDDAPTPPKENGMDYTPVKCPSCGSNQIVLAANEMIYCKSCDGYFEKNAEIVEVMPLKVEATPEVAQLNSGDDRLGLILFGLAVILIQVLICAGLCLAG